MKKFVAVLSGILLACGIVLFAVYHLVNVLPPEGTSYNMQAISILEDATCENCHGDNNETFDIRETVKKLKNDTVINEVALAKIEYVTVTNPVMPPKIYCLTHWGTAINSSKTKLLKECINHQRSNYYNNTIVSELYVNEPVRPVQKMENTDGKKTELGRRLFFDNRLSADNSVSCNTCHHLKTGGTDNRQYSRGTGKTLSKVNTPTIFNACFNFKQFWDGRSSDLYSQLHEHLLDPSIMGNSSFEEIIEKLIDDKKLKDDFLKIYSDSISQISIIETIAEFEKTLVTPDSRFDKYLKGGLQSLNEAEIAGYKIFKSNKCATCHAGTILGGQSIEKLSIHKYVIEGRRIPCIDIINYDPENFARFRRPLASLNDNMNIIDKETLKATGQTVLDVIYNY